MVGDPEPTTEVELLQRDAMLAQRFELDILAADLLKREEVERVVIKSPTGNLLTADFARHYHRVDLFLPEKISAEFLSAVHAYRPDVLLVDIGLPSGSGITLIRHVRAHLPHCEAMVVTVFAEEQGVLACIQAGATGYLLKDATGERIAAAIHELRDGGSPISPSIARRVLARFRIAPTPAPAAPAATPAGAAPTDGSPLSQRETEILRLVAKGFSFETVGEVLGISSHTVVTHVKKIYRKLAVHSRGEAVYEAGQMGLL